MHEYIFSENSQHPEMIYRCPAAGRCRPCTDIRMCNDKRKTRSRIDENKSPWTPSTVCCVRWADSKIHLLKLWNLVFYSASMIIRPLGRSRIPLPIQIHIHIHCRPWSIRPNAPGSHIDKYTYTTFTDGDRESTPTNRHDRGSALVGYWFIHDYMPKIFDKTSHLGRTTKKFARYVLNWKGANAGSTPSVCATKEHLPLDRCMARAKYVGSW